MFKLKRKLLPILFTLFLFNSAYAQSVKINLSVKNESLKQFIKQIETKTDYTFMLDQTIDQTQTVTVDVHQASLDVLLKKVFAGKNINYEVVGKQIILKLPGQSQNNQSRKVTGIVKDQNGEPIIGVNVIEKGTTNGIVTDADGKYELTVSPGSILLFSYIGYNTQEIKVGKNEVINVSLREDAETLDEVVVIGYGTVKKSDLTGAVSSVKMSDAPVATISTVSHALAGKAAGLQATTISAQPGGNTEFRIRGAASPQAGNDPLIIVDGFPVSDPGSMSVGKYDEGKKDNILASINPNDIESIEVLKDASSTAIYGARAGNGVIIVTTKKGKAGKPNVKYSGSVSTQNIARNYEVLDAHDFMLQRNRYYKEKWMRDNKIGVYCSQIYGCGDCKSGK